VPQGTPIRLVQENGKLIELEAQTMVMTTSRKVGGSPIPFTGSKRIGLDLNVNSAMINVQGVVTDDTVGGSNTPAVAKINFGKTQNTGLEWNTSTNRGHIKAHSAGFQPSYLKLEDGAGAEKVIYFNLTGGSTAYVTGQDRVQVNTADTSLNTTLPAALRDCINARFGSSFTASVETATQHDGTVASCQLKIVQDTAGRSGNNSTPLWVGSQRMTRPHIESFGGGATGTKKSAGDKVMDLYGILNNSVTQAGRTALALGLVVGGIAGGVASSVPTGGVGAVAGAGVALTGVGMLLDKEADEELDYIVGIQIPYNSLVTSEDGVQYSARNFFMPTGYEKGLDKTSVNNLLPASVDFDMKDKFTGIQGAVQKMDITYNAGEMVYEFNMIFAPIDGLI